uniref:Testis expressed 36 n=2 Tax=Kryptolebias marmoratus TaxID=37003 RepID=A0A3Q3BP45_KRYMA
KVRNYPLSCHDNKHALKDNIRIFSHGLGRRKSPDDFTQHYSNFCLCDGGADSSIEETNGNLSTYRKDFTPMAAVDVPNRTRRFPRNHKLRSEEAAKAQAEEQFMWFGQDDANIRKSLEVLAATCRSA